MSDLYSSLSIDLCKGGFLEKEWEGVKHVKTLPFLSLVQAVKGEFEVTIDGTGPAFTGEGGCFTATPGAFQEIIHHQPAPDKPMWARWVFLDVKVSGTMELTQILHLPRIIPTEYSSDIGLLIQELLVIEEQPESLHRTASINRIAFSILEVLFVIPGVKLLEQDLLYLYLRLMPALQLINGGLSNKITVNELAQAVGLSIARFHSLFRQAVGHAPMKYIQALRLKQSAVMLVTTPKSVYDIAESMGFYDQFHFSRIFKKQYGLSPLHYRVKYHGQQDN